jgi:four helix bundle protein
MVIQNYTELEVYQLAFESAMQIYELSKKWPVEERYSLTDQIRRASRSVCSNIAESWRKRRYPAHFVSKLSDADTEAAETEVWLNFALSCKYIENSIYQPLQDNYDHICRMLTKMMSNPDKWYIKAQK